MNRAAFPHRIVWLSLALALLLAAVWPLAPRRPEAAALGSDTQRITNLAPALYASVQSVAADQAGAHPQQPPEAPDGDDWVWRTFTSENSPLAPGSVNALLADDQGRVWIGTDAGISVYQHGVWRTFTSENSSLAPGFVLALLVDDQGRVWAGTGGGVSLYQDGIWQTFTSEDSSLAPGFVLTLLADDQGRVWVGTEGGLSVYQHGDWQTFTSENSPLAPWGVWSLLADDQGRVWVGTDSGVSLYQDDVWQTFTSEHGSLAPGRVNALLTDDQNRVWAGIGDWRIDSGGVSVYQDGHWQTFTSENSHLAPGCVNTLLADDQGRVWAGTDGGLTVYQRGIWRTFTAEHGSLAPGSVNALVADDLGQVWAGIDSGVSVYQHGIWQTFTSENNSLAPGFVLALLIDDQGRVWAGTGGGVSLYQEGAWQTFTSENSSLAPGFVSTLLADDQERVWVGTWSGASFYQDGVWQTLTSDDGLLAPNRVRTLLVDDQGQVWAGTDGGVSLYQNGVWQAFTSENSPLTPGGVWALLADEQGQVWAGTGDLDTDEGGVSVYQGGAWQTSTADDSPLARGRVNALLADDQGRVWVGTSGGVSFYQDGFWQTFTAENSALAPGSVTALIANDQNRIWAGTGDWSTDSGAVSLYRDGVWQSFNTGNSPLASGAVRVLLADNQGRVWIGTTNGASRYTPQTDPPWAFLKRWESPTASWQSNKPLGSAVSLAKLDRDYNRLRISFIGADLESHPSNIRYRYQLRERDKEWSVTADTTVTYHDLPPGSYTFVVQSMDEDGMFSPEATLEITVPFYWYERREYQVLLAAVLLTVASGAGLGLRRRVRSRRLAALRRGEDPYVVGAMVEDPDKFYGRQETLDAILTALAHDNHVAVYGERRIGKTSLLYQLAHHLRELSGKDKLYVPVFFSFQVAPEEGSFFANLAHAVADAVRSHTGALALKVEGQPAEYVGRDLVSDLNLILAGLREKGYRVSRIILLLDEGDVLNGYDAATQGMLRGALMTPTGQNVLLVWSGQAIERTWRTWGSPWYNLFKDEIQLGGLEEAEARRLIVEPVKGLFRYDEEAMARILSYSQRIPYRIQRLCSACVRRLLAEERFQVTAADVDAVRQQMDAGDQARADQDGAAPLTYEMKTTSQPMAEEETGYDPNDPQEVQ